MNSATQFAVRPATNTEAGKNPFPGLRPFQEDEEYLFFGRENQVDAMVDKLAATRFLAVVGGSGSGKSSLVNCGLRPALHGGLMAGAGTVWRMAQFRPGSDPMGAMAQTLAADGVLFSGYQTGGLTLAEIVDTTLRMSKLGLIDIYEQANLSENVNLLVVVDQFEELFRYRQIGAEQKNGFGVSEEDSAFVNLLLETKEQTRYPIYVVLTMRSDFLGDCAHFPGLAEAVNAGQYLVPRMSRDERRAAICGPIEVFEAEISPVLLTRLVNDVGDNPDQLSILQHALNRTWARWQHEGRTDVPLDLPHYEAIGTMAHALDQHAEKAYAELSTVRERQICEKIFKALTDKATDPRGVRRPTMLRDLCTLAGDTQSEIIKVIEVFRKPSRSFLMPPVGTALEEETVIDISHESLMRVWERLKTWADEEARSARIYSRLAGTAVLHNEGQAGLLRGPELELALKWHADERPNKVWAKRYHPEFASAIGFLDKSRTASRRRWWTLAGVTFFVFAALTGLVVWALFEKIEATKQTMIAEALRSKDELYVKPHEGLIGTIVSAGDARRTFHSLLIPTEVRSSFIEALQLVREGGIPRNSWAAHGGEIITSVGMSDDGQLIVTGGWDANVRLWDRQGKLIGNPLIENSSGIKSVAISPDGRSIAGAGPDGVKIWDQINGVSTLNGKFWSVAMASDGQTLAVAGGAVGFLLNRNGTPKTNENNRKGMSKIRAVSISGDGKTAVLSGLNTVRLIGSKGEDIWKQENEQEKDQELDRSKGANTAVISRDGQLIVIGYQNGFIRLWNRQGTSWAEEIQEGDGHDGKVSCLAISADGQTTVSGGEDGTVRLWNRQGKRIGPLLRGHVGKINSVALSADGKSIVSVGDDGMVRLFETRVPSEPAKGYEGKVDSIGFGDDGRTILTAGRSARLLRWSLDGIPTATAQYDEPVPATVKITATAWSSDGKLMVIGRSDGKLLLRQAQGTSSDQAFSEDHTAGIASIAVSEDRNMIVSGDENGTVRLWDREGRPIGQPSVGHDGRVASVATSSDGKTIISGGSDGKVLSWNRQGFVVSTLSTSYSTGIGETVAVSPNGEIIASGSERGMMRLWDERGNLILLFKGHEENISCLAFSSDSKMIVSGADDATVRLWDRKGNPIGQPFKDRDQITSVALSPDKNTLVSGDKAGNVMIRQIGIETFLREACDWLRYHRALTEPKTDVEKKAAEIARSVLK